jgi:predicted metalloprotease with PDZ domain
MSMQFFQDRSTAFAGAEPASAASTAPPLPVPEQQPAPIRSARDVPYPGVIELAVDATDTDRGILQGRMTLPVAAAGPLTLLYPKWMPGYHSPQNPIELLAGLQIKAGDTLLDWRRDPVEVYAFHLEVPSGVEALEITYQFLSPTTTTQGDVVVTHDLLNLQWGRVLLYPAGHFSRQISVRARLTLPAGWVSSSALLVESAVDDTTTYELTSLDVLVDTPVMAGRVAREVILDDTADVRMSLFARDPEHLEATTPQIALYKALVAEAQALFGSRHFDRYRFLVALSDELGGGGVEHHRSAEIIAAPDLFKDWVRQLPTRDVMAHEFTHSWNGKFRRGADSWTPSFELPIRNSLMWLYEGQTQYWGQVLTARAGLWSLATVLEALAKTAATYDTRPGGMWRPMADTTRDPIIAARAPLPWPSWQRSEDYYSQGQLMWLAVDTLIRELTDDKRSLDDFAKLFFGIHDGAMTTCTYQFGDVVDTLNQVAPHDWEGFLKGELETREPGAPLEGLERGGYRLVYRDVRSDFCKAYDALNGQFDLRFSIGLNVTEDGTLQEVVWGSPAFDAGLTAGSLIQTVNGEAFDFQRLGDAITAASSGDAMTLRVASRSYHREVTLDYTLGHRFPHLERLNDVRPRLDEIFAARVADSAHASAPS